MNTPPLDPQQLAALPPTLRAAVEYALDHYRPENGQLPETVWLLCRSVGPAKILKLRELGLVEGMPAPRLRSQWIGAKARLLRRFDSNGTSFPEQTLVRVIATTGGSAAAIVEFDRCPCCGRAGSAIVPWDVLAHIGPK